MKWLPSVRPTLVLWFSFQCNRGCDLPNARVGTLIAWLPSTVLTFVCERRRTAATDPNTFWQRAKVSVTVNGHVAAALLVSAAAQQPPLQSIFLVKAESFMNSQRASSCSIALAYNHMFCNVFSSRACASINVSGWVSAMCCARCARHCFFQCSAVSPWSGHVF